MQRPEFSEFSFGFGLTQEVLEDFPRVAAPTFPSLREEGRHGGYDVHIPAAAMFLQFKLAYRLRTRKALEFGLFGEPYLRSYLHRRDHSQQHRLLLELESLGHTVLYAAPTFHLTAELNQFYTDSSITANTAFFRPSDIGPLPDNDQHYVVFVAQSPAVYFCSKPVLLRRADLRREIDAVSSATAGVKQSLDRTAFARQLIDALSSVYQKVTSRSLPPEGLFLQAEEPLLRAGLISRLLFDCELLVLGAGRLDER